MRFCEECGAAFQVLRSCPRCRIPTRADLDDPLLGQIVGERYRVLDRLGAGGMGMVYRVGHVRIASLFAMKVLYGDNAHDPESRARFQREAEAVSLLGSRHIVRVVDFGESDKGLSYLVMEHVDGVSLSHAIQRAGTLPEARSLAVTRQIARALVHAHERGIVHRDLKPDNVMLVDEDDEPGIVKILDFGLAAAPTGAKLTRAGQIFGTPEYMAPEQFYATTTDARSDLYAVGVILYEMLTGLVPFEATTLEDFARRHATVEPPPISQRAPQTSPALVAIAQRLMAKRPDDRFPSARSLLEALRALDPGAVVVAPPPSRAAGVPRALVDAIHAAIQAGAPMYNAGDHAGCLRLYWQASERALTEVLAPLRSVAVAARLRVAITRARAARTPSEGAWEMRYAFDDILHAAAQPAPAQQGVAGEIALAESVGASRYGAGGLDVVGDYGVEVARGLCDLLRGDAAQAGLVGYLERVIATATQAGGGRAAVTIIQQALEQLSAPGKPTLPSSPAKPTLPSAAASPASAASLVEGAPGLDRHVQRLVQTIAVGAPTYNAGDIPGCARLYRHAAEEILRELSLAGAPACRLAHRLQEALRAAATATPDGAAWTLRHAFDEILAAAAGPSSLPRSTG